MSVATSTAIAITLGAASAAGSIYAAKKGADASRDAAAVQSQAAQGAQQLQREQFQQTQANLSPYMQAGAGGLTALTSLLGVAPNMAAGAPVNARPPGVPSAGPVSGPMGTVPGLPNLPAGISATELAAWRRNPTQAGRDALLAQGRVNASAYPGGTVTLRAPTGQTQAVPAEQVDFFLARGATRV